MAYPNQPRLGELLARKLGKSETELSQEKRRTIIEGLKSLSNKVDENVAYLLPGLDAQLKKAIEDADAAERAERVRDLADTIRTANSRLNESTFAAVDRLRELRRLLAQTQQQLVSLKEIKEKASNGDLIDLIVFAYPQIALDPAAAELLQPAPTTKTPTKKAR